MINPMRSSPTRMMGLSSGMDTDAIIQQTLRLHQFKIDNQMRNKKLIEWRQQTHNSIKNEISSLRSTFLSTQGSKTMMSRNVFNATTATVTGRNSNAVSVRTATGAAPGTIRIDQIISTAKGASMTSAGRASVTGQGLSMTASLKDLRFADGATGKGITFDTNEEASFLIDGVNVTITSDMTVNQMLASVNQQLEFGNSDVKMSYDARSDRFSFESATVGGSEFTAEGDVLEVFGFAGADNGGTFEANVQAGTLAKMKVTINGVQDTVESSTNRFTLGDVTITVNETTAVGDEPIMIALKRDASKAVNAITDFINSYNAIIGRLEGLLNERKTSSEAAYKPLTDEEKQGMTEKQIEEWEAIAKKGLLRNDQGIQNLVFSLRSTFFKQIEGVGLSPSEIGLSTGSYFDGTGGKIIIDEEKLRKAIEDNPDKVADIFIKIDDSGDRPKGVGLLYQVDELMRSYVNTSQSISIKNLEDSLKRANEQIGRMQTRMYAEEDKLYRQFAAMESAMSKLNQQGDWFSAMLGGK